MVEPWRQRLVSAIDGAATTRTRSRNGSALAIASTGAASSRMRSATRWRPPGPGAHMPRCRTGRGCAGSPPRWVAVPIATTTRSSRRPGASRSRRGSSSLRPIPAAAASSRSPNRRRRRSSGQTPLPLPVGDGSPLGSPSMRVPPVERRRRGGFRIRGWMIAIVVVLVVLFLSARGLAGFYTDYLWFDSVGFGSTWRGLLWARFAPTAVFTILFFVLMLVSLTVADRLAPAPARWARRTSSSRGTSSRSVPTAAGSASRSPRSSRWSPAAASRASGSSGSSSPTRSRSGSRTRSSTRTSASTCSGCRS